MPSAIKPCDFDNTPTTICAVESNTFTTTLTHVERDAAAARSAAGIRESSSVSGGKFERDIGRRAALVERLNDRRRSLAWA